MYKHLNSGMHLNVVVVHAVEELLVEFLDAPVQLLQLLLVFAPLPLVPLEKPVVQQVVRVEPARVPELFIILQTVTKIRLGILAILLTFPVILQTFTEIKAKIHHNSINIHRNKTRTTHNSNIHRNKDKNFPRSPVLVFFLCK